jgi:hypothetical protein
MRIVMIAALCLAAAACSRSDNAQLQHDTKAADHDLNAAASDVKNNPDVKQAAADAKDAGHDAAVALRAGAADVARKSGQALVEVGAKTKEAAADARRDAENRSDSN